MNEDQPVFPAKLYLFDDDGTYDKADVTIIPSEAHLNYPAIRVLMRNHIQSGREVRLTDPGDNCLFHAKDGKIIFPS